MFNTDSKLDIEQKIKINSSFMQGRYGCRFRAIETASCEITSLIV